jgi:hypothetical protein
LTAAEAGATLGRSRAVVEPPSSCLAHATTEDGDVTTLFITNKPFDIRYAFEDEQDSSTGR